MIFLLLAVFWSAHVLLSHFPILPVPAFLYSWDAGKYTEEGKVCVWGEINQKAEFLIVTAGLKGSVLLEFSAALSPGATQTEPLITAIPVCSS